MPRRQKVLVGHAANTKTFILYRKSSLSPLVVTHVYVDHICDALTLQLIEFHQLQIVAALYCTKRVEKLRKANAVVQKAEGIMTF